MRRKRRWESWMVWASEEEGFTPENQSNSERWAQEYLHSKPWRGPEPPTPTCHSRLGLSGDSQDSAKAAADDEQGGKQGGAR